MTLVIVWTSRGREDGSLVHLWGLVELQVGAVCLYLEKEQALDNYGTNFTKHKPLLLIIIINSSVFSFLSMLFFQIIKWIFERFI